MIFETFARMLQPDERIQFTVTRKGDQLTVLIQPVLHGSGNATTPEDVQALRAALSMPLYVTTSPEVLDRDFPRSLAEFADLREQGYADLKSALSRIKESGKQANAATSQVHAKTGNRSECDTGSAKQTAESDVAAPNVAAQVTTKSLF